MEDLCRRYGRYEDKVNWQLCVSYFHSYTPPSEPGHSGAVDMYLLLLTMQSGEFVVMTSLDLN